jgi:hypothetical protein
MNIKDCTFIFGFGLAGYRSFGPELQRIGPCQKINLLIGQNNSGKSNILRFVHDHYPKLKELTRSSRWELRDLEKFRTNQPLSSGATLALRFDPDEDSRLRAGVEKYEYQLKTFIEVIRGLWPCGSGFWFDLAFPQIISNQEIENLLSNTQGLRDLFPPYVSM